MKILKQLECVVYFNNDSQTTLCSEPHCHSSAFVVEESRKLKDAFQTYRWVLAKSWLIQTASTCSGPALNGTLLGHRNRTVKDLIMALMPYCLWRHKAMFLH